MSKDTIFFSYSRDDSEFVLNLAKNLRVAGANIWLDQLDIKPGARWDRSIEKALEGSSTLLVILSKSAVNSNNVMDEVSYALEENKQVVPVLLEECDIPFRLRRLQYADFSSDHKKGINTLINALHLDHNVASKLASVVDLDSKISTSKSDDSVTAVQPELEVAKKETSTPAPKKEPVKPVETSSNSTASTTSGKKSKSMMPIIIGVFIVVIGAVLFFFKDEIFKNKDQIAWDLANKGNVIEDYEQYKKDFPNGKYVVAATDSVNNKQLRINEKQDEHSWKIAKDQNTTEAYETYIGLDMPIHKYVQEAQVKLDSIRNYQAVLQKDTDAWNTATETNSVPSYLAYYKNNELLGNHRDEAIDKIKEIGKTGWLYVGRSDGEKMTNDQLVNVVWRRDQTDIAEDALPQAGDIVKLKSSAGSRSTYPNADNRNTSNGYWNKAYEAFVIDSADEGSGNSRALILQVVYPK